MSSRKGNGSSSSSGAPGASFKGKGKVAVPSENELAHGISDLSLNSAEDDGRVVYEKKTKNKGGSSIPKQSGPPPVHANAWGQPNTVQKLGIRGYGGPGRGSGQPWPTQTSDSRKPAGRGITPPVGSESAWPSRPVSVQSSDGSVGHMEDVQRRATTAEAPPNVDSDEDYDEDDIDDSDDDLASDGFDSDESQKSHETKKKNKWFKELFDSLDKLTVSQINEPERQWHCPACKGGPGAIDWYRGLLPLISHARTKRSKRVKLHRELAQLLDEELLRRGTSAVPVGEAFGKWKGLEESDKEIVWPPMVMIMNTRLEKDVDDKWIGMGNPELLDYFNPYSAQKARHSYGPQGHRGISVLIFESSAVAYTEAERLSKHFEDMGTDRNAWGRNKVPFHPGGKRQLYGFMAEKQDLENFNQHSQGKPKLKYELKSYRQMVVIPLKQMSEDNQQLQWYKQKVAKEQKNKKALEESYSLMAEKLRETAEKNKIMKLRTKKHHEQNKEQMDTQEQYFNDQIREMYNDRNTKEENFERMQQFEWEKMTRSEASMSSLEENRARREEIAKQIQLQEKEMGEFVQERNELVRAHQQRREELKRMHFEQEMALEKEFDANFNQLLYKYTPKESNLD